MMLLLHWRVVVYICVVLIAQSTQRDNLSMLIFFFLLLSFLWRQVSLTPFRHVLISSSRPRRWLHSLD
jgi:hypothetical protein